MKPIAGIIFLIILLLNKPSNCQGLIDGKNLVQNSSFEEVDSCPGNSFGILFIKNWWPPNGPSAAYYSACAPRPDEVPLSHNVPYNGNMEYIQYAHSGNSYVLLGTRFEGANKYWTSYIENKLIANLNANSEYCIEFYVNLPDFALKNNTPQQAYLTSNYITGLFTDTSISTFPGDYSAVYYYDYEPSFRCFSQDSSIIADTLNWLLMSSQYYAKGNEKYLTIGSFQRSREDFFVLSSPDAYAAIAGVYIDDVAVYKGKCREEEKPQKTFFNLYPNPGSGVFSLNYGVAQDAQLLVYDILGRTVFNETLAADKVLHHFTLQQCSSGMYFLKVLGANDDELYSQKFLLQR
jgi:hypothetical protein